MASSCSSLIQEGMLCDKSSNSVVHNLMTCLSGCEAKRTYFSTLHLGSQLSHLHLHINPVWGKCPLFHIEILHSRTTEPCTYYDWWYLVLEGLNILGVWMKRTFFFCKPHETASSLGPTKPFVLDQTKWDVDSCLCLRYLCFLGCHAYGMWLLSWSYCDILFSNCLLWQ